MPEGEDAAKQAALAQWPGAAVSGGYSFAETVVCGPDPERHRAAIQEYLDAGQDHVYVHQVGDDQEGFFRFYGHQILPAFS
jgi:hypothetical protein